MNAVAESQSFRSQYGRKGIRVAGPVPTYAIRRHLGNVHVGASFADVERETREQIQQQIDAGADGWTEAIIRDTVRFTLWQHAENRAEYAYVMGGH